MRKVHWTYSTMLRRHNISVIGLQRELLQRDIVLSPSQLFRLRVTPRRLSVHLLEALCDIFKCSVSDLLFLEIEQRSARLDRRSRYSLPPSASEVEAI